MTERVSENKICPKCDADIRSGALFCYSCGSTVEPVSANGKRARDVAIEEESVVQEKFTTSPLKPPAGAIEKPIGVPLELPADGAVAATPEQTPKNRDKKLVVQKETNLKTAASLRKRPKTLRKEPAEIVWEAPESSSHVWFVVVSFILIVFAVLMLMAMLYLR